MLDTLKVKKIRKGYSGLTFNQSMNGRPLPLMSGTYTIGPNQQQMIQTGMNRLQGNYFQDLANKQQLVASSSNPQQMATNLAGISGSTKSSGGGANTNLIGSAIGAGSDMLSNMFAGEKDGYNGKYGDLQQTGDQAFDQASNAVMAINPLVGGIMKAGGFVSDILTSYGGMGTDSMTKTDAVLGSKLQSLTPWGMINGFFGQTTDKFNLDTETLGQLGSSYSGAADDLMNANRKQDKKYGAFSSKARRTANREIAQAKLMQSIMQDISSDTQEAFALRDSMSAINGINREYRMQGGYDPTNTRVGRSGMKIENINRAKEILSSLPKSQKLQSGGKIEDEFKQYLNSLPEDQRNTANFRVRDYWEYNGRPKNFEEAKSKGMFKWEEDFDENGNSLGYSWHAFSVAKNPTLDEYEFMKSSSYPSVQKELDWYNSDDAYEFRKDYELQKTEPYWKYVRRKSEYKEVPQHKQGGSIQDIQPTEIILVDPNDIPEFQEGGQINKKSRTLEELIQYAKEVNPRFIQRMSEPLKYVEWDDNEGHHFGTHELGYTEMDGKYFVYPSIQEGNDGSLIRYTPEDWKQAVDNAYKNKNGLFFNTEEEAKIFTESQENPDGTFSGYKSGWSEFFKQKPTKYQNGGAINVIPDGALHARKHNMEMNGITQKGIPVVSETEDGKVEQQAEIERSEVILRLEVTKTLEELMKKYYNENTSQKEKDEYALEAGKLLTQELIYNTIDNTGEVL